MTVIRRIVAGATLLCAFVQIATASHPGHHAPMRRRHVHHLKRDGAAASPAVSVAVSSVYSAANAASTGGVDQSKQDDTQNKDYSTQTPPSDDKGRGKDKYNDDNRVKNGRVGKHNDDHDSKSDYSGPGGGSEGSCAFPDDAGLVRVPGAQNMGWAMSPDQPCKPGNFCPYACPPGQVSMQWDPKATSYTYPLSMNGGLYCDKDGKISKPFPDRPYCEDGVPSVMAEASCDGDVAFCQTVLPGNEAMLIPTNVGADGATLAVPGPKYWAETAAHYYINAPGVGVHEACVWGTNKNPVGNWSPYVAGANTDRNGNTFVKIGWNPIYLEPTTPFRTEVPKFGVKIECVKGQCNGLPCYIDPKEHKVNEISCADKQQPGAGGATFCVATVPKDGQAKIVVFTEGGRVSKPAKAKASPYQQPHEEAASLPPTPPTQDAEESTSDEAPSPSNYSPGSSGDSGDYQVESYTPPKGDTSDVSKYPVLVNNETSPDSTMPSGSVTTSTPAAPPSSNITESNTPSSASSVSLAQLPILCFGIISLVFSTGFI